MELGTLWGEGGGGEEGGRGRGGDFQARLYTEQLLHKLGQPIKEATTVGTCFGMFSLFSMSSLQEARSGPTSL